MKAADILWPNIPLNPHILTDWLRDMRVNRGIVRQKTRPQGTRPRGKFSMRRIFLILTLASLTAAAGCRIPPDPFDECGPTYTGECGTAVCDPYARAGSVLSPPLNPTEGPMMQTSATVVEGDMPVESGTELDPVPTETEMEPVPDVTTPYPETTRVVPVPAPPRSARRTNGPMFLR